MEPSMHKPEKQQKPLNDLSRSLTPFDPNRTLITVVELSKESWLVAGIIPGVERQPLKKLKPDENELLKLLEPESEVCTVDQEATSVSRFSMIPIIASLAKPTAIMTSAS